MFLKFYVCFILSCPLWECSLPVNDLSIALQIFCDATIFKSAVLLDYREVSWVNRTFVEWFL